MQCPSAKYQLTRTRIEHLAHQTQYNNTIEACSQRNFSE